MKKPKAEKPIEKPVHQYHISNCNFQGAQFDHATTEVYKLVAQGLINMTELFKSQCKMEGAPLLVINQKEQS